MGVTVTVQDETRPGSVAGTLTLDDIPVAITLRDLIPDAWSPVRTRRLARSIERSSNRWTRNGR